MPLQIEMFGRILSSRKFLLVKIAQDLQDNVFSYFQANLRIKSAFQQSNKNVRSPTWFLRYFAKAES